MFFNLEVEDAFAKLNPLSGVGNGLVEATLSQAQHLSGDPNPALVQHADGVLVSVADLTQDVLLRNLQQNQRNLWSTNSLWTNQWTSRLNGVSPTKYIDRI